MIDMVFARFAVVGLANTAVGLAVIYIAMFIFGLGNVAANLLGYSVGVLTSFVLNKRWTFGHRGETMPALSRFVLVIALAYSANIFTVLLATDGLGWDRYVAQALGILPYMAIGYFGSRLFAFASASKSMSIAERDGSPKRLEL